MFSHEVVAAWPLSRSPVSRVPLHVQLGYAARVWQVVSSARGSFIEAGAACGVARRTLTVLLAGALLGLALERGWLVCPIATLFSVPCPGCGLTRAALLLARGDFSGAIRLHPLAPLLVPLVALAVLRAVGRYLRGSRPADSGLPTGMGLAGPLVARWLERAALLLLVALFAVWVLRFRGAFGGPVPVAILLDR